MFQLKSIISSFFLVSAGSVITACGGGSASDQDFYGPEIITPSISSISSSSATEGDTLYFIVTLSSISERQESYNFSLLNITTNSSDYSSVSISDGTVNMASGQLNVNSGVSSFNVMVDSTDDQDDEGNESFTLTIDNQSANGNILDNDGPIDSPTINPISNASAAEGEDIVFAVSLSDASTSDETYSFQIINGTANAADYDDASFSNGVSLNNQVLTVSAGITNFNVVIPSVADTDVEQNETFTLSLGGQSATGIILDDDGVQTPPTINPITDSSANEGDDIVFAISLSEPSGSDETYSFEIINGTANAADLGNATFSNGVTLNNQLLTVGVGITTFNIVVPSIEDTDFEENETFSLSVGGQSATGTILNDDSDLIFTSDSILYVGDQDTDEKMELYTYSVSSNQRIKLNQTLISCEVITGVTWSNDGSNIFFTGDQDTEGTIELYSIPPSGSNLTKLNGTLVGGGNVERFEPSPDNEFIAYLADQDTDGTYELYTVRFDGSNNTKVSGGLASGGNVTEFRWSDNGATLSFLADANVNDQFELFTVNADGTNRNQVNGSLIGGGNVTEWKWLPDSSGIVYRADEVADDRQELFFANSNGSGHTNLNNSLVSIGETLEDWKISPDSTQVLYLADHDTPNRYELFSVDIGSGNVNKINAPLILGGTISLWDWAPDSSKISYVSDELSLGIFNLYTTEPDGSNRNRLNTDLVTNGEFTDVQWSTDSTRVLFAAPLSVLSSVELYSVNPDGTSLAKLNDAFPGGVTLSTANSWKISPDGSRVAYQADQNQIGVVELFVVPTDGSQTATLLNSGLVNGGDVANFSWASDSQQLVYLADQDSNGVNELFWVSVDGLSSTKVNGSMVNGGDIAEYTWLD